MISEWPTKSNPVSQLYLTVVGPLLKLGCIGKSGATGCPGGVCGFDGTITFPFSNTPVHVYAFPVPDFTKPRSFPLHPPAIIEYIRIAKTSTMTFQSAVTGYYY